MIDWALAVKVSRGHLLGCMTIAGTRNRIGPLVSSSTNPMNPVLFLSFGRLLNDLQYGSICKYPIPFLFLAKRMMTHSDF